MQDINNITASNIPQPKPNIFKFLFIISLLALVTATAYFNKTALKSFLTQINNKITGTVPISEAELTLAELQKSFGVSALISKQENSAEWFDQSSQRLPLDGYNFKLATFGNEYIGKWGNYSSNDIKSITKESLKPLQISADLFFKSHGFQKDDFNTSRPINVSILDPFNLGYTKNDLKCLVSLSLQADPFAEIFCGTLDQIQINWRQALSPVVNQINDPNLVVDVINLSGNYAMGGIRDRNGSGVRWWAVKINNKWDLVWESQSAMSCQIAKKYKIPKDMSEDCYSNFSETELNKFTKK